MRLFLYKPGMRQLLVLLLAVTCEPMAVRAQGTIADYERAAKLRELTSGKVVGLEILPIWSADGGQLWYRWDKPDGAREYLAVNTQTGEKSAAFDQAAVAKTLGEKFGQVFDPNRLPIQKMTVDESGVKRLTARVADQNVFVRVAETEISIEQPAEGTEADALDALPPSRRTRSTASSTETSITFINRTKDPVRLFWVNEHGERQEFATIAPDAQHDQHTFSGHAWLATTADESPLAVFIATESRAQALITGPVAPSAGRSGQGRGQTRRGSTRSPDGKYSYVLRDHNAFLVDLATNAERQLTTDGSATDSYGSTAFWSPDSSRLVVIQTVPAQNHEVHYVESSPPDQLQPKLQTYHYLKPGDQIAKPRPRMFDTQTGELISIDAALFDSPWSIGEFHWSANSSTFFLLYNQRGHQVMRLVAIDVTRQELVPPVAESDGIANASTTPAAVCRTTIRPVIDEQVPTFFDYSNKTYVYFVEATNEIIWMSERNGWNHLYLIDATTGLVKNQITSGGWVVRGVDQVDVEKRQIFFRAMGTIPDQDPYHMHSARVNFDGSGLTMLTAGDGTHSIAFSPDRQFIVDTYSRADLPPVHELRRVSDGSLVCELDRGDAGPLVSSGWMMPERFVAKGRDGSTDIWGLIFRPTNFDPTKAYPIIESIYAGPHGQHVPKRFSPFHSEQALAELGFIVVKIDGMGTNWRSKAFHDVCWKNIADAGFPDRKLWIKAAAAKYPYMDVTRVGIYGGSAGGQNAMRALLDHNDLYDAAVADCGCHDNRMDKIWWNEAWMGWPVDESYEKSSNVVDAHKLVGHLLLTVGEADRNVDPASTMQVADALIKANKDFELIVFPGGGHGSGSNSYGTRRTRDFFVRHLLGVEPRAK